MMKHIYRIFSFLLLLCLMFSACAGKNGSDESSGAETDVPETSAHQPGQQDRAVLEDYRNIVPSGIHEIRMLFLNVGKGDAILLRIDGRGWLIDTGTEASLPMLEAGMRLLGLESLHGIFITHTDSDHVGSLRSFLAAWPVDAVFTSSVSADWNRVENLRGDTPRIALDPGSVVEIGEGIWFEVLGPIRYNPRDDNNSLVLRLRANDTVTLFCGDMMVDEEKTLMYAGMDLNCDLLKVGHHGKKDATSESFALEASPSAAIVCASKEDEKEAAHKSVLKLLKSVGAEVYVTEDTPAAYDVTVSEDGRITVADVQLPEAAELRFVSVSKGDQLAVIGNGGDSDVSLAGWWILSETGSDLFRFPEDAVIPAGGTISVGCTDYAGVPDLRWNEGKVWHKSKEDRAILIDPWGRRVDIMVSE